MASRPRAGRGLFLTRDSGGEHETTPSEYVRWAQREAARDGVRFTGTPEQIEEMIRNGESARGDVFLDFGVQGNQLSRPGIDACLQETRVDLEISHIYIPRRDRFARPDDPLDAIALEACFRKAGVWLVYMDKRLAPLTGGRPNIAESIVAMIDFDKAGVERRDLAQKMIYAQIKLATGGYSTGGRPDYGFDRWLVQVNGNPVRRLEEGEYVKRSGHHVVWLPGNDDRFRTGLRILTLIETMPARQVALLLTKEGIPTPDADRWRMDRGVRHRTSGVWHATTVTNIARNPLWAAIIEHGTRSMGDVLRFTPDGPRDLQGSDRTKDEKPKVVVNPPSGRVRSDAHFPPPVDPERFAKLQQQLDERAGTQRGKQRSTDPTRNPLGSRVFDMACGWPMYRQPYGESFRYGCGLNQQSAGAKCSHNYVDGLRATQLVLGCLLQRAFSSSFRENIIERVRAIAERETSGANNSANPAKLRAAFDAIRGKRIVAERNLALAENEHQFRSISKMVEELRHEEQLAETRIHEIAQFAQRACNEEDEVAAAITQFDQVAQLMAESRDLSLVGQCFQKVNARLFLRFRAVKPKKRIVNRVDGGVVTFGDATPPVELYAGRTSRSYVEAPEEPVDCDSDSLGEPSVVSGREGKSLGNVNRGERI